MEMVGYIVSLLNSGNSDLFCAASFLQLPCYKIVLIVLIILNYHVYPQPEDEERMVVYNNIGPNVCMGDHKVTALLNSPFLSVCCIY